MPSERLIKLVKEQALELAPEGEFFTLKSGAKSKFYLDCRNLNLTPTGLHCVVTELWNLMHPMEFDAFGGPSIGADPIIGGLTFMAGLSVRHGKRGFLVRKEGKDHGKAGRIVGPLKKDHRCVIVEDVTTTGASAIDAIEAVEEFGAKVIHIFCVVDRMGGGAEAFAAKNIPFTPLLAIKDLGLE
jgi:orotate phosphoribosyltransferase